MRTAIACLFLALFGCAKNPVIHPGAVNSFDSQAYDTLITVQAALETASKEVVSYPALKPELNKAIDGYNSTMIAYKAFHEAMAAGKPADQAALAKLISDLSTAVAQIVAKLHPASAPGVKPVAFLIPSWAVAV